MVQDLHWEDSWAILLVIPVPVNYAFRLSGPVTALTARRVRYGVGPDLICQPGSSPGIKTHSSPAAFPTTLSHLLFPSPLPPSCAAPSCLRPRRAPLTPYYCERAAFRWRCDAIPNTAVDGAI